MGFWDGQLMETDALAQEVRYAKNFSINQLGDQGQLAENSPLSEAMVALDVAVTDLGGLSNIISNDDSAALLTKDEAREAVQGRQHPGCNTWVRFPAHRGGQMPSVDT